MRIPGFLLFAVIVMLQVPLHAQRYELEQQVSTNDFSNFVAGKSVADGLSDLQKTVDQQGKELEKFKKEFGKKFESQSKELEKLASEIDDKVSPGRTKNASMKIVGRVHADYWAFPLSDPGTDALEGGDGPQDRLGFRRVRFGVRGTGPSNMEYRIEMEFVGGNESEFRDVWLGWNDLPILQKVLVGNQKRPYGLDHLNSSRYNVFLERPFVIEANNQDARRLGMTSNGVSEDQAWNWRYGVYNQRLIQDEGNYINDHYQLEFAARIANTMWYDEASDGRSYVHWALSGTTAYPDGSAGADNEAQFRTRPEARTAARWIDTGKIVDAANYQLIGVEGVMNFGPLQIVGEFQNIWLNRDNGGGPDLHFKGGYVYASYFLTGEHIPWSRKSGTLGRVVPFEDFFRVRDCDGCIQRGLGAWQIAARYSMADYNSNDIFGGIGESFTLGLNWHWSPDARVQVNWIKGEIENSGGNSGDYEVVGVRMMIDF